MRKFLLSTSVLVIFALYAIHIHSPGEEGNQAVAINSPQPSQVPLESPVPPLVSGSTPPPVTTPIPTAQPIQTGRYKNGTYIGDVADAFYGNIQVQVIISGGQISDVQFLQYPNDRNTSIYINSQAMPLLKQEAIQAQSANVSGVSGASASSQAFIESLGVALQKAM